MACFEVVSRFKGADLALPVRKTQHSAGYDFAVAEDTLVPAYRDVIHTLDAVLSNNAYLTLNQLKTATKLNKLQPTLVSTGIKAKLDPGTYLELSVRSSTPLNYWLVMANGIGIIDLDYYGNAANEGEIFFQLINLGPRAIMLKKGDMIGQGIIKPYLKVDDDLAKGERVGGFGSTDCAVQA